MGPAMKRMPFVSSVEGVKANINYLNGHWDTYLQTGAQPGKVAAWYVVRDTIDPTRWRFGPSRFVGYESMKVKHYLSDQIYMNGGETEAHLQGTEWFVTIAEDHPLFRPIERQLVALLDDVGTKPRSNCRINVLSSDIDYKPQTQGHVFISYAKATRQPTEKLAKQLAERGYDVWWDTDLISGEAFEKTIRSKIDDAGAVIVIWTSASVNSQFVKSEADRAFRRNKIVCVMARGLTIDELPMPYDQLQTVDAEDVDGITRALDNHGVKRR